MKDLKLKLQQYNFSRFSINGYKQDAILFEKDGMKLKNLKMMLNQAKVQK